MDILKKLAIPKIFLGTIANIVTCLLLLKVINSQQVEVIQSIASLLSNIFIQLGIFKTET